MITDEDDEPVDRSKLDIFYLLTSERVNFNESSAKMAMKHVKKPSNVVDMVGVLEPLNAESLESFIDMNTGSPKGVKMVIAVVLDGKKPNNAHALKGSGTSVSKTSFSHRLLGAVRSLKSQLWEWHKHGNDSSLTADVAKMNEYLRFNGDIKTKADSLTKFLDKCSEQLMKKQGELPTFEEFRVNSDVEICKNLILNLANKVTAEQLTQLFGTAISKPGEIVLLDEHSQSSN